MTQLSLLKPARQHVPITPEPVTLESQLLAYEFPAAFAGRLAEGHGWTLPFALEVLREYRRFLVLAATSGQSVTPSQVVDAAWHEHLTHTRDYWLKLTPLLPGALHHEPGDGNPSDDAKFAGQYQHTLELYRQRFGEPNSRIWPDPTGTPNKAAGHRSGNAQLWILFGIVALGLGLATLVNPWVGFGLIAVLLLTFLATRPRRRRSGRGSDGDGGDAGLFVLGFLGGGDAGASGSDGGSSDSSGSDGGSSCGSSCGGGCGS